MRILIVSGIWPPDVGGPASHAPELADFLRGHGHAVEVVTTADAEPAPEPYRVDWVSRRLPVGVRHAAVAERIRSRARGADVVYATSMIGRAAGGTAAARRPLVIKLTTDEAYERARRRGLYDGDWTRSSRWTVARRSPACDGRGTLRSGALRASSARARISRDGGGLGRPERADARRPESSARASRASVPRGGTAEDGRRRGRCSRSPGGSGARRRSRSVSRRSPRRAT